MLLQKLLIIFVYNLFQSVSQTTCYGTVAFAIDDTLSMVDIDQVKQGTMAIMSKVFANKSNKFEDMVLVTINDPDVVLRTKTSSVRTFMHSINNIRIHSSFNSDCPEMVLTGIETALTASRPESYIIVFTDASAKDYFKVEKIKNLCQQKRSQVVIVLTGFCRYSPKQWLNVYYDVAKYCSGQVYNVNKYNIATVFKTIETLLEGETSILKTVNVPKSATFSPVKFDIDEKTEYALISTSGLGVRLHITSMENLSGPAPEQQVTMWNRNAKVVKLINPKPGSYYAWVKGASTISLVVYGQTNFTFDYGFSVQEPTSLLDTFKQPIAGLKQHIMLNVTDPDYSVDIKTVLVVDINNNDSVIDTLPVIKTGDNIYVTEPFVSPNRTFRIAVKGEINETRQPIVRISRTTIDPQSQKDSIPKSVPEIKEGTKLYTEHGSSVNFTSNVSAHPKPKIEWYKSNGILLPSKSSITEDPNTVIYLELINVQENDNFTCKSCNEIGNGTDKQIDVVVRPVPAEISITKEATVNKSPEISVAETDITLPYDSNVELICEVNAYPLNSFAWRDGPGSILEGKITEISQYKFVNKLNLSNMKKSGFYVCEASNEQGLVDKYVKVTVKSPFEVKDHITGTIGIYYGASDTLQCDIKSSNPMTIQWFKQEKGVKSSKTIIRSSENYNVSEDGVKLTIKSMDFDKEGIYTCEASLTSVPSEILTFSTDVRVVSPLGSEVIKMAVVPKFVKV